MDIEQLREQRAVKTNLAQKILDKASEEERDLTAEERTEVDGYLDEIKGLKKQIEDAEDEERRSLVNAASNDLGKPQKRQVVPRDVATDVPISRQVTVSHPHRPLKAFARAYSNEREAEEMAYRSGQWLRAQLFGDEEARLWCYDNMEMRILKTNVNTGAGYLIPPEFETAIITNRETFGVARSFARIINMTRDTMDVPRWTSSPAATAVGEGKSLTAGDPTFDQVTLTARKWARLTRVTSEMLEDTPIDLADWLARDFARSFAEAEDDALFNGDGTSTYHGIRGIAQRFDDDNSLAGAVDPLTASADTFAELADKDISKLTSVLPEYALTEAAFYISQPGWALSLERLAFAAGGNTILNIASGMQRQYHGYPVRVSQKMPTSSATLDNKAMILFGDMMAAVIFGDRRGIRLRMLMEKYADTDEIGIQATERFDINAHGVGDGTTAGPVVALIGAA